MTLGRLFILVLMTVLTGLTFPASNASGAAPVRPSIRFIRQGKITYLYLRDVAAYYGMRYAVSGKTATFTSVYSRLMFTLDSRVMTLSGVRVHLAFAISRQGTEYLLSISDFQLLIDPILRSTALPRRTIRKIVLDPGHGGKDVGATAGGVFEKTLNLQIAARLATKLRQRGYTVVTTRSSDTAVSLAQRSNIANKWGADLFISLHCNAADASVSGIEIFSATWHGTPPTGDKVLAKQRCPANAFDRENAYLTYTTQKALLDATNATDRGIKRRRFSVIRNITCPGMLIEMGFISNQAERQLLQQANRQDAIAHAIADAVDKFRIALAPKPTRR